MENIEIFAHKNNDDQEGMAFLYEKTEIIKPENFLTHMYHRR